MNATNTSRPNYYAVKNLCAGYSEKTILQNISLEIPAGLIALIGPNGCGKTTLLNVLAGLKKYSGSVTLGGVEVKNIPRKKFSRLVSFVMSDKNFRPSYPFSAREIISMGRLPYKNIFSRMTQGDEEIILRSAERLGISSLLSRDIMTLSDGERQLVFIACALAQDTKILLLDEPTNSLDPDKAAKVFALFKNLADEGRTIIAAIHDVNIFSDYYMALRGGVLISHGKFLTEKVLHDLYGANFIAYHNHDMKNIETERNAVMWRALPE